MLLKRKKIVKHITFKRIISTDMYSRCVDCNYMLSMNSHYKKCILIKICNKVNRNLYMYNHLRTLTYVI